MTAVVEAPQSRGTRSRGGLPAALAVGRWAWRLFRKEWRQQSLVLVLVTLAVATTVFGLLLAANSPPSGDARSFIRARTPSTLKSPNGIACFEVLSPNVTRPNCTLRGALAGAFVT